MTGLKNFEYTDCDYRGHVVDENGCIDGHDSEYTFVGFADRWGRIHVPTTLSDAKRLAESYGGWKYKNGNPRFQVAYMDHGSLMIAASPRSRGIAGVNERKVA
jgi:hypothetical protein